MAVNNSRVGWIKKNQKESLLFKEISVLIQRASLDDSELSGLYVSRVELSDDKSCCRVYFFCSGGEEYFKERFERLKLYKPSLRAALAKKIQSRYVPQIIFKFDDKFEKKNELEELLESIKSE